MSHLRVDRSTGRSSFGSFIGFSIIRAIAYRYSTDLILNIIHYKLQLPSCHRTT